MEKKKRKNEREIKRKNLGVFKEYNLCEFARKVFFSIKFEEIKIDNSDELLTIQNKT
jgi:hypothetical protein